jgi:hypothetical protein
MVRRSQQRGWYLSPPKIPLAENRFLQTGNGAENTKEKSRQCFTYPIYNYNMCVRACVRVCVRRRFRVLMERRNRPGRSDSENGNRPGQPDSENGRPDRAGRGRGQGAGQVGAGGRARRAGQGPNKE